MSKEDFIAALEELVLEEMERTGCDWLTAHERTADAAYDAMCDEFADRADAYRQRMKDEG